MKVLVTAATSHLGRIVRRRLLSRGHEVLGWASTEPRELLPSDECGSHTVFGDPSRPQVREFVLEQRPNAIVQVARAELSGFAVGQRRHGRLRITRTILDWAHQLRVEAFVHVGSHTVYGAAADLPLYRREEEPLYAVETFPEQAEAVVTELMAASLLWSMPWARTVVLRPCFTLGASARGLLARLLENARVPVLLGFDPLVQLLHEDELGRAVVDCLERPLRGVFNLAGGPPIPLSEVIERAGRVSVPLPEAMYRLSLRTLGLSELPAGVLGWLKHPILVDDARYAALATEPLRLGTEHAIAAFAGQHHVP